MRDNCSLLGGSDRIKWRVFLAAAAAFSLLPLQISLAQPTILTQPQSQIVGAGTNVTFSVQVLAESSPTLPTVSSGTLQLWLAADTDVSPDGSGLVSDWPDLSGNGNDAVQYDASLEPSLVKPAAIGGRAALRFNGIQTGGAGTYLEGNGQVQVPDAMTAFTVYMASAATNNYNIMWVFGIPGDDGADRGSQLYGDQIGFTFWAWDYPSSITIPTNTYRLCIDQVDSSLMSLQISDVTAAATSNVIISTYSPGIATPQAGYNVGGYNPSQVPGLNFAGDMAEIIIYQGMLSSSGPVGRAGISRGEILPSRGHQRHLSMAVKQHEDFWGNQHHLDFDQCPGHQFGVLHGDRNRCPRRHAEFSCGPDDSRSALNFYPTDKSNRSPGKQCHIYSFSGRWRVVVSVDVGWGRH